MQKFIGNSNGLPRNRTSKWARMNFAITTSFAAVIVLLNMLFMCEAQIELDEALVSTCSQIGRRIDSTAQSQERFLVFSKMPLGQGAGNQMQGLLAAHLLGLDFNRIVCIGEFEEFHQAFDVVHEPTRQACIELLQCERIPPKKSYTSLSSKTSITLINFMAKPDECELHDTLASEERVIWFTGNTYPGGWRPVPDNLFFTFYKPKQELVGMLPYPFENPPQSVVHLRAPDNTRDIRRGLDKPSLDYLGQELPSDTYLVTNRIAYYSYFSDKYGWSHPTWQEPILHSALSISWDDEEQEEADLDERKTGKNTVEPKSKARESVENLQLWADWLSILTATTVRHTHSDFSSSAAHWNNELSESSMKILNYDERLGKLHFAPEDFLPLSVPFSERKHPGYGEEGLEHHTGDQRVFLQNCAPLGGNVLEKQNYYSNENNPFAPILSPDRQATKLNIRIR